FSSPDPPGPPSFPTRRSSDLRESRPRTHAAADPSRAQVVLMMSTEQGAWWETLFGTEPSRKRFAPVMPLFPTTIRSAFCSSATRSEEHTSELQSRGHLVCRLL